jgi:hypothetical protein
MVRWPIRPLTALVDAAGLTATANRIETGAYTAPSVDAAVATRSRAPRCESASATRCTNGSGRKPERVFAPYTAEDGSMSAPFDADLVVAQRR